DVIVEHSARNETRTGAVPAIHESQKPQCWFIIADGWSLHKSVQNRHATRSKGSPLPASRWLPGRTSDGGSLRDFRDGANIRSTTPSESAWHRTIARRRPGRSAA